MTRDELRELISAPAIRDRYEPDHVRHYAGLQLDALSAAGYAVVDNQILIDLVEYLEGIADAEYLPGDRAPTPNEEMRLLTAIAKGNILEDAK